MSIYIFIVEKLIDLINLVYDFMSMMRDFFDDAFKLEVDDLVDKDSDDDTDKIQKMIEYYENKRKKEDAEGNKKISERQKQLRELEKLVKE